MAEKGKKTGFKVLILVLLIIIGVGIFFFASASMGTTTYVNDGVIGDEEKEGEEAGGFFSKKDKEPKIIWPAILDKEEYDKRLLDLAHYVEPKPIEVATTTADGVATTTIQQPDKSLFAKFSDNINVTIPNKLWPPANPYPNGDAILPFYRILAYYGNFYSVNMGILGEFEEDEVIRRLMEEKASWEAADPNTPVMPAIEHIAMVAQGSAGEDGMYRSMMPEDHMERAYQMAKKIDGIVIYDLQIGLSTAQQELPKFKDFLTRPEVHIALDPEFSMKSGGKPGTVIGTSSADDINYMINYMSDIVKEHKLPPKVLLVHRFTQDMVTGYDKIKPTPEVQVVVVMDGWGSKDLKRGTYWHVIEPEPVQFAGVKIFYKNDLKEPSTGIFTPQDVLELDPKPIYVQYQ
ncbi:hypothetical protein N9L18_00695 [Candidatus Pacebacteria bacterium]|nr:hypothetical protein [Candidatus Paceibacterota bacterium]